MNKEFPFDRWWRKHVTPWRLILAVLAFMAWAILGPFFIPHQIGMNICMFLLYAWLVVSIPMLVWWVWWGLKYPITLEYCKECGRAKPIKYEDEDA